MSSASKWSAIALSTSLAFVTACTTPPHGVPPPEQSVQTAKQACEVNALAEEHYELLKTYMTLRDDPVMNKSQDSTDERWTILSEKLEKYRGEIEASYRFVTSNCLTYNMCMAQNQYNEHACVESRQAWEESNRRFNELAIALNNLKKSQLSTSHGNGCGDSSCTPKPVCDPKACEYPGSVFSNCCSSR